MRSVIFLLLLASGPALADRTGVAWPWSGGDPDPALPEMVEWLPPALDDAPALCITPRIDGAEGYLNVESREIVLDGGTAPDLQRGVLLHELRHLDQLARGFCPGNALSLRDIARAS